MSRYAVVAVCSECGEVGGPASNAPERFRDLCQHCGMDPGSWVIHGRDGTGHWIEERRRWEPRSVWWKPWTWLAGEWVRYAPSQEAEER